MFNVFEVQPNETMKGAKDVFRVGPKKKVKMLGSDSILSTSHSLKLFKI
jgi:hypothetical protein